MVWLNTVLFVLRWPNAADGTLKSPTTNWLLREALSIRPPACPSVIRPSLQEWAGLTLQYSPHWRLRQQSLFGAKCTIVATQVIAAANVHLTPVNPFSCEDGRHFYGDKSTSLRQNCLLFFFFLFFAAAKPLANLQQQKTRGVKAWRLPFLIYKYLSLPK